ncbi:hypothetical protein CRG98_017593 [Punica granatum]|uniref:G-patch domain-containing protein n=1 Tax=Punica granatum TaxID=22663 RepID=A0A2I0K0B8_PUNGR|nr:hypothetical protein CRG98_017593 [Punica granatum]
MRIWRTLRPVDRAFIQDIIGDMVMLTETPVDWIFLRTATEFWDPEHAVFNFQGTELAPTIEEYTALIQRPTPTTQGIFRPNLFTTVQGQLSALLRIPAQDIHEELHQRRFWRELTPSRFLWVARWNPGSPMITGCPGIVGVPLLSHLGSTLIFLGRVIRQLGGLQDIPAEADRLPFRLQWADSTSTAPDRFLQIREIRRQRDASTIQRLYFPEHPTDEERAFSATSAYVARFYPQGSTPPQRSQAAPTPRATSTLAPEAEKDRVDISEEVNPPASALSQPLPTHAPPPPTPVGMLSAYSGAPSTHLQPPASSGVPLARASQTPSATDDQARITALEGTVNQMAANMAELLALLRGLNRASSSSTPPPGQGPTVDPAPGIPPAQVPENMDAPAPPTLHTSVAQPLTNPYLPPPAPTAVPLPPAAFLTSDQVLSAPPPVSMPAPAAAYTVPPPTVFSTSGAPAPIHFQTTEFPPYSSLQPHAGLSYPVPPPINTTFHEPGTPAHAAQFASPTHFFPEADAEQERRLKRMEETIRALQANDARPDARYEFKAYGGTTDPRHHLRHYWGKMLQYWEYEEFVIHSFQDSLSGSALDWFMSLKAEDIPTWEDLSRKFIDQYRYCTETPPTLLELSTKEMARGQRFEEYAAKWPQPPQPRPPVSRAPPPTQQNPTSQVPQVGPSQHRPRRQYTPLPAPLSHIYRQLLAGNQIQPIYPGPNFDPSVQDQSKRCEYHQGAPGHTLDNYEETQENPPPFVINYTPKELTVGFTGHGAPPAVVDVPAQELYSDSKVPWTYEGSIGSVEQQFGVMGITRSGRVYESPMAKDKGKAPTVEDGATPESSPFPSKKVTEEEAEALMKIVKASEYKVVEQMAKSPAHISLLALLLGSEPHREALLPILTAAQVPKETPLDRIEETIGSIFSNTISFSDDELPSEGWSHSRALHIVCKCNNYIIGRVMIDNGSALNVCPVTTLKQMNVDLNRVRPSKTAVRAFDGSRREVNGEIDLLIDVGPCSFSIAFQVLDIPNVFSLLLGRPWIYLAGAVPSSLHQRLKFIVEEKLITVKGEEDYAIYKETAVPYISIEDDENLPFHSFETISIIQDYGESGPSRADRMIGKVLLRNNYIPGTGLGARGQGINRPIEIKEYKYRRGLGFRPSWVHIRLAWENEELDNWTSVSRYSAVIVDV